MAISNIVSNLGTMLSNLSTSIGNSTAAIVSSITSFNTVTNALTLGIGKEFGKLRSEFDDFKPEKFLGKDTGKAVSAALSALVSPITQTGKAIGKFGSIIKSIISIAGKTAAIFSTLGAAVAPLIPALGTLFAGLAGASVAAGVVTAGIAAMSAPIAIGIGVLGSFVTAVQVGTDALLSVSTKVAGIVKAFSPAAFELFMDTLYDLTAVIGMALMPILQAFTMVFRSIADTLLPILRQMEPIFVTLGRAILSVLTPVINTLGKVLLSVMPALAHLAIVIEKIAPLIGDILGRAIESLIPIIIATIDGIAYLLDGLMPIFDQLATAVIWVINAFTYGLSPFIYATTYALGAFAKALSDTIDFLTLGPLRRWLFGDGKKQAQERANLNLTNESRGMGAREAKYQSVEELSRNLIASAYSSSASIEKQMLNVEKQQLEVLQKIAGQKQQGPALGQPAPGVR
jgi:phage-related protein